MLRVANADLPPPLKRFRETRAEDNGASVYLDPPVRIAFPPDRSELDIDDGDATVVLKAEGGSLPLTWLVNGDPAEADPSRREIEIPAPGRGFLNLSVIDANGRTDRVTVRLK